MDQIVCEVCGSNDLVKQSDVFLCTHCGAKYSTEAVKQMVAGVVVVDRTNEIGNLLALANAALQASNPGEAYTYANRALEIDSRNPDAWFVRGKAAGWSSTLHGLRLDEMLSAFTTAVGLSGAERHDTFLRDAADEVNRTAAAFHSMSWTQTNEVGRQFDAWPHHVAMCNSFFRVWDQSHRWSGAREPLDNIVYAASNLITGIKFRGVHNEWRVVVLQPAEEAQTRHYLNAIATMLRSIDPTYVAPTPKRQKTRWL